LSDCDNASLRDYGKNNSDAGRKQSGQRSQAKFTKFQPKNGNPVATMLDSYRTITVCRAVMKGKATLPSVDFNLPSRTVFALALHGFTGLAFADWARSRVSAFSLAIQNSVGRIECTEILQRALTFDASSLITSGWSSQRVRFPAEGGRTRSPLQHN
jgi:hypothetical protein